MHQILLIPMLILLSVPETQESQEFKLSQQFNKDGFSIRLPPDWREVPNDVLSAVFSTMQANIPEDKREVYDCGFQRRESKRWLEYPYVLIKVERSGRIHPDELTEYPEFKRRTEEGLGEAEELLEGMISKGQVDTVFYDSDKEIIWQTMTMEVAGIGVVKVVVGKKLTNVGGIDVVCYVEEKNFDKWGHLFGNIIRSVKLDEQLEYQSVVDPPQSGPVSIFVKVMVGVLLGVIGASIGISMLRRKRGSHQEPPNAR